MNMVQEFALNLILMVMLVGAFMYGLYQLALHDYEEGEDNGNQPPKSNRNKAK